MNRKDSSLVLKATFLVSVGHYGALAVSIATQLAFARLVPAAEIGAFAIAFGLSEVIGTVFDVQINRAVIAGIGPEVERTERSTVIGTAWTLVWLQTVLFALLGAASWVTGAALDGTERDIARLAGLLFVAKGAIKPGFMGIALREQQVRFGIIAALTLATAVIGAVVGIAAATHGLGGAAICLRDLVGALAYSVIALWLFRGELKLAWNAERAVKLLRYSVRVMVSGVADRLVAQLDTLLLGRTLDLAALGTYSYARRLLGLTINACLPAIQRVLFASYGAGGAIAEALRLHRRASEWVFTLGALGALVLVVFPAEVARVVLGPAMAGAAQPLAWLAPLVPITLVAENDRTLLVARGRFRETIVLRLLQAGATAVALVAVTRDPSIAAAGACVVVVAAELACFVATRVLVIRRVVGNGDNLVARTVGAAAGAWGLAVVSISAAPIVHRVVIATVAPLVLGIVVVWARSLAGGER